ncbi:MAG: arginine deiminase-related protein [Bacteroidota bacterium]|nr:arginine deiminase-related protein [Bacteroidota bacterium]
MTPDKILMCKPEYFEVNYSGNDFMENNIDNVDRAKALNQWEDLKKVYEGLGYDVKLIEPVAGLVDMVFTANQSFPFTDVMGNRKVILSKMKNVQRKEEVKHFEDFFINENYEAIKLPEEVNFFESMGDCVIDYERNILFGGYGFRTQEKTYDIISNYINFKIIKLKLINPILYHLDTCLSILNSKTAVICKSAFDKSGLKDIKDKFENLIIASEEENLKYFVCNCHCPDGKNVIVQKGSSKFKEDIKKSGFNLIEVETGEFIKSGGSVFCMKLMFY